MKMKRMIMAFAALAAFCAGASAQESKDMKVLVAYYSATGTTERAATQLASAAGATLYEIQPEKAYSSADLNWNNSSSRSTIEMKDAKSRPAIVKSLENADAYDVIYIGFPIWWDEAPRVINTFIEAYGFKGKTVIPFATSGGSSITNSQRVLQRTYPDIKWQSGRLLNGVSKSEMAKWVGKQN